MSKRHQSSRRKSYGRRQHEVRERTERRQLHGDELAHGEFDHASHRDPFGFFDLEFGGSRLSFALGD